MPRQSPITNYYLLLLLTLAFTPLAPVPQLNVTDNTATVEFPDRITFSVKLDSDTEIQRVILEYGVANQLTCGEVIAKAFPEIAPGQNVSAEWTWEMRQSGSEPPGAEVWWRWRVIDSNGVEQVTDQQTVVWLDSEHEWQTESGGNVDLHWYNGDGQFGADLHASALKSLAALEQQTGLKPESPIDLYIYGSTDDMREAILYEPGWTGGLAYPDYDIVIIGIGPSDVAWGKRTQAHELTHVLVGHLTFSCLGAIPTWLNEGLAVYGEGGPDEGGVRRLQEAIVADTLLPVRSLSGGFAEDPAQANLSYSQSYSLVNFLIEKYGRDRMLALLGALRDSATIDEALTQIYGFNVEGLEDEWRAAINAQPRAPETLPTPTTVPTIIPTLIPISGAPISITSPAPGGAGQPAPPTATAQPLATPVPAPTGGLPSPGDEPPAPRTSMASLLAIGAALCACALCLIALVGGLAVGLANRRRENS